jgi:hypothetical protein
MGEPIDPAGETVLHGGHAIGFCCAECAPKFAEWSVAKKDEFVARALAKKT